MMLVFVVQWREVAECRVTPPPVVPRLEPFKDSDGDVVDRLPGVAFGSSVFTVPIRDSHMALSRASPTVPMLGVIAASRSLRVKAKLVYCDP
jgi:hypothetical protein